MPANAFSALAQESLARGEYDLLALSAALHLPLSGLAARLEGSVPFTVEEALDLCRVSDHLLLLKWVMERLGAEIPDPPDVPPTRLN